MGAANVSFQDLNLSNYFLFAAAAENEETSRLLLETLLGIKVGRVFLSTKGTNDADVPKELVNLLHYVENSTDAYVAEADDPNVRKLHDRVKELKRSRGWEASYMLLGELMDEQRKEGREEGFLEGHEEGRREGLLEGHEKGRREGEQEERARILRLTGLMIHGGESDLIGRLGQEPEFLEAMLQKYHL